MKTKKELEKDGWVFGYTDYGAITATNKNNTVTVKGKTLHRVKDKINKNNY